MISDKSKGRMERNVILKNILLKHGRQYYSSVTRQFSPGCVWQQFQLSPIN